MDKVPLRSPVSAAAAATIENPVISAVTLECKILFVPIDADRIHRRTACGSARIPRARCDFKRSTELAAAARRSRTCIQLADCLQGRHGPICAKLRSIARLTRTHRRSDHDTSCVATNDGHIAGRCTRADDLVISTLPPAAVRHEASRCGPRRWHERPPTIREPHHSDDGCTRFFRWRLTRRRQRQRVVRRTTHCASERAIRFANTPAAGKRHASRRATHPVTQGTRLPTRDAPCNKKGAPSGAPLENHRP